MTKLAFGTIAVLGLAAPAAAGPGEIRWVYGVEAPYAASSSGSPAVGRDGRVYWSSRGLRALTPAGQEIWHEPTSGSAQLALGADGTIYTGGETNIGTPDQPYWQQTVRAIAPDGQILWEHILPPEAGSLTSGPMFGADVNLYLVTRGPGYYQPGPAVSLTTNGDMRWQLDGFFGGRGATNGLAGADGRFYVFGDNTPIDAGPFGSDAGLVALDLDGQMAWYRPYSQGTYTNPGPSAFPGSGNVVFANWSHIEAWSRDGAGLWAYTPPWSPTGVLRVIAGPDGSVYVVYGIWNMQKLSGDGALLWTRSNFVPEGGWPTLPAVSPDGSLILVGMSACIGYPDEACPSSVTAIRTSDGSVAWSTSLPRHPHDVLEIGGRIAFSPDGSTAYASAGLRVSQHAYLFALETGAGGACGADLDGSGVLTLEDFVSFRNLYVAQDMAADFDGNGVLGLNDFVAFRNLYMAGCP